MPGGYDYLGWLMEAFSMSNGGRYFNEEYGGEVYYDQPSMLGAARFVEDLVFKHKVMPQGVTEAGGVSTDLLRRQGLDGVAVDRLAVLHPREHEAGLRRGLRAEERAQRGADRRRLAGHVRGPERGAAEGRLEVHQVADHGRDAGRLEPLHRLLRAAQDRPTTSRR